MRGVEVNLSACTKGANEKIAFWVADKLPNDSLDLFDNKVLFIQQRTQCLLLHP